jgi:GntR family transcriptional repressor for pyruvate dehydrogenase complex
LVALGILRSHPGKGVFVVTNEVPDNIGAQNHAAANARSEDFFQLRLALEPFVVGLVAQTIAADELAQLRLNVLDMREAIEAGHTEAAIEADIQFHQQLVGFSRNPVFAHVMQQATEAISHSRQIMQERSDNLHAALHEHEQILACIKARDSAGASRAMQQHILNAGSRLKVEFLTVDAPSVFNSPP